MKLYTYWRSSSAHRVRIALHLKGIDYDPVYVHLVRDGGAQHADEYRAINPMTQVPVIEFDDAGETPRLGRAQRRRESRSGAGGGSQTGPLDQSPPAQPPADRLQASLNAHVLPPLPGLVASRRHRSSYRPAPSRQMVDGSSKPFLSMHSLM